MRLQVPGLPVYGVAIPTVAGVKRVLDVLGAQQGECVALMQNPSSSWSEPAQSLHARDLSCRLDPVMFPES